MSESLPAAARSAWQAYEAMEHSKRAHLGYLQEMEEKYRHGGSRSLAEAARLQSLLQNHDRNVSNFRDAVRALATRDPAAHRALVRRLQEFNRTPGAGRSQ